MELDRRGALEVCSLGDRPGASALWISIFVHCVVLLALFLPGSPRPTRILPGPLETATLIQGKGHISFRVNAAMSLRRGAGSSKRAQMTAPGRQVSTSGSASTQALQQQAAQQTAAITKSLKFRGIYGFYPGHDYQLPIHQSGELPSISLKQFPTQIPQFVIVEITIDDQGAVADAQIVNGMVVPAVQKILLAAVREFKYIPAKRDGMPIPSQLDIVVPLPG